MSQMDDDTFSAPQQSVSDSINASQLTAETSTSFLRRADEDDTYEEFDRSEIIQDLPTLSIEQVEIAKKQVAKHHPTSHIPLSQALPFLQFLSRWFSSVDEERDTEYTRLLTRNNTGTVPPTSINRDSRDADEANN